MFNNNSIFANEHLIQTNGTATGAPNSCSYADIAISSIDNAVFEQMNNNFKELLYFGRYRDDCIGLWCGNERELNGLFEFINTLSPDLKFTMEVGGNELCFLDLCISLKDNLLATTVYSKKTDAHLYLHADSCHNKGSINGIPKGVALRLRRICSSDFNYDEKSKEYTKFLTKRGYNEQTVTQSFDNVKMLSRSNARKRKERKEKQLTVFSTSVNPRGPNVARIINKHLPLINNHPELSKLFPKGSIMVANKRESNLKDLLCRSDPYSIKKDLTTTEDLGYIRCNKSCDSCDNFVQESSFITCNATGRKFKIRESSTCSTKNVIYMAYCKTCGKQGVGSTTSWKPRLANYKNHIRKKIPTCRIVKHFINECVDITFKNAAFIIIDVLNNTDKLSSSEIDDLLLKKEQFWIGSLVTQHKGMNGTHDWYRSKRTEREKGEH